MAETKTTNTKQTPKMVTIRLPRIKDRPTEFVSINMRTWMVERGKEVEVPKCVAAQIRDQEKMLESMYEYEESVQR